mmetsp:Transcript_18899/g.38505  ORF Transcript_18899/g.38505 Transcript_18899/m.38505 type:complete len:119 (-) Transcript_18899:81-437(-)
MRVPNGAICHGCIRRFKAFPAFFASEPGAKINAFEPSWSSANSRATKTAQEIGDEVFGIRLINFILANRTRLARWQDSCLTRFSREFGRHEETFPQSVAVAEGSHGWYANEVLNNLSI